MSADYGEMRNPDCSYGPAGDRICRNSNGGVALPAFCCMKDGGSDESAVRDE